MHIILKTMKKIFIYMYFMTRTNEYTDIIYINNRSHNKKHC